MPGLGPLRSSYSPGAGCLRRMRYYRPDPVKLLERRTPGMSGWETKKLE
jgi:hypothetical protein